MFLVKEDPAHFIPRLKSLKRAVPGDDLAGSSDEPTAVGATNNLRGLAADDASISQKEPAVLNAPEPVAKPLLFTDPKITIKQRQDLSIDNTL